LTGSDDLPSREPLPVPQVSASARATIEPASILELELNTLAGWLKEHGQPAFRAKQIWKWIYQGRADSFQAMTDLPLSLRQLLSEHFRLFSATCVAQQGADDGTQKLLLQLVDGGRIECVLLRDGPRRSICVSSQVGCAMGCVFCASGLEGVERNLTTAEIIEQMLRLQRLLPAEERLSHIVMMGMGEPLANLSGVLPALERARSGEGLSISPRRITISTVGLPKGIDRLAATESPYQLAISLHAPNDPLRNRLVPVNHRIGIQAIMEAADRYFEQTGRRLTFEYVLLAEINDDPKSAQQLVQLLRGRCAMLNVIPYNPVPGLPYQTPSPPRIATFRQILLDGGLNVLFRQRKGDAIQAACGQLRHIRKLSAATAADRAANGDAALTSISAESGPP
jgi:23S rRNA (adenine2503-C2)-methyltransferase